jgi:hypothetical protein
MKLRGYSSLAAFMAHYAALRTAHSDVAGKASADGFSPDDAATLIEMERVVGELNDADRDALHDDAAPAPNALPSDADRNQPKRALRLDADAPGARSVAGANSSGATVRHRARAELKLRRLLIARGILTG